MFKQAKPLFLIVETPLHAGSGSDLGIVDLPIQREKHTDYPKIEASGLKGAIREVFRTQPNLDKLSNWGINSVEDTKHTKAIDLTFGPDTPDQSNQHAGALGFTDARLLLFPVKSVKGVFAWITCPAVLERFKHDLSICQPSVDFVENIPDVNTVPNPCKLIVNPERDDKKIVLEEYTFPVTLNDECDAVAEWIADKILPSDVSYDYWCEKMKKDIVVLRDDDFRDFVMLSTEVIARTKIDSNTGTVDKKIGGLWYEEYLPTDSILYSLALTTPLFVDEAKKKGTCFEIDDQEPEKNIKEAEKVMNFFADGLPNIIQIGGNATVGKGIVRTHVYKQEVKSDGTGSDETQGN
ncbi:MAG: type III-B CRISPR module RAMP protein Cmr4 [Candidatus Poribacteria bacterium]|nr:type III-B CRISPR module RAMP protein Cmr4 [Candidatus Poribacteria bacterium]